MVNSLFKSTKNIPSSDSSSSSVASSFTRNLQQHVSGDIRSSSLLWHSYWHPSTFSVFFHQHWQNLWPLLFGKYTKCHPTYSNMFPMCILCIMWIISHVRVHAVPLPRGLLVQLLCKTLNLSALVPSVPSKLPVEATPGCRLWTLKRPVLATAIIYTIDCHWSLHVSHWFHQNSQATNLFSFCGIMLLHHHHHYCGKNMCIKMWCHAVTTVHPLQGIASVVASLTRKWVGEVRLEEGNLGKNMQKLAIRMQKNQPKNNKTHICITNDVCAFLKNNGVLCFPVPQCIETRNLGPSPGHRIDQANDAIAKRSFFWNLSPPASNQSKQV